MTQCKFFPSKIFFLFVATCFLVTGCTSIQLPDLQSMAINLSNSIPSLWHMVVGLAYLFGVAFIFRGVYALKIYGEMRTQMSSHSSMRVPVTLLLVGTALLFLPTTKAIVLTTIFAYSDPMPLSYTPSNPLIDPQATQALLQFVQLIGLISFVRGWILLSNTENRGQSNFGKALTHIVGGIAAINIEGVRQVLQATLGINT